LEPLSQAQSDYINSIKEKVVSIGLGYAGTGKTYIAATLAAQFKIDNRKDGRIVLCRPNISDSRTIGYLKGDMDEKMAAWVVPYTDVLRKHLNGRFEEYVANGTIEVVPFEYMQGRSWDNSYIMLDEAQHTSPKEMEMFLKRIGTDSKVVISGDLRQAAKGNSSGLANIVDLHERNKELQEYMGITGFFNPNDIVRSDFCRMITRIYGN
jgi:phosphate starvation-inducible PhoH-like protein|tara:strand:- start:983 stop:1609 length:627 start_codon:yes stop_codon:yes gene_type:complete